VKKSLDSKISRLIDEADHLYAVENRPAKALQRIEQVLRLTPDHTGALIIKGRILVALDRVQEAMKCYDSAISIDPMSGEGFLERARILYAVRQANREALREVKKALARADRDRWTKAEGLRLQGNILSAMDRDRQALASYRAALRLNPRDSQIRANLGEAL